MTINSSFIPGVKETPISRALQRIAARMMTAPTQHIIHREAFPFKTFIEDGGGEKIEDYAYRVLGRAFAKAGKMHTAVGMPQLKIISMEDELWFEWTIPTATADVNVHRDLQRKLKEMTEAFDFFRDNAHKFDDETYELRVNQFLSMHLQMVDRILGWGATMEFNERATEKGDEVSPAAPPSVER